MLEQELRRYVRELSQDLDTVGIVVFGSLGGGVLREDSDIDLMVVKETSAPFLERLRRMRRELQPKVATDFLVYTPEEVAYLWRCRPFFRVEIMGRGKVLYERERGTLAQLCA